MFRMVAEELQLSQWELGCAIHEPAGFLVRQNDLDAFGTIVDLPDIEQLTFKDKKDPTTRPSRFRAMNRVTGIPVFLESYKNLGQILRGVTRNLTHRRQEGREKDLRHWDQ